MLERLRNKRKLFNVIISSICIGLLVVGIIFELQIDTLNKTNSVLQENNSQLSNQLQALQSQLLNNTENLQANLNAMEANYTALLGNLTTSQNSLTALEAQQNALQTQQNALETKPQPDEPFNYLVYSNATGNYVAENGATLAVDYSGNNATEVIQSCIDSLLSGDGGKIILAGTLNLEGPLVITQGQSNGTIEIDGYGPSTQLIVPENEDGIDLVGTQAFGYGGPYNAVINDLVLTTGSPPQSKSMENGICIKNWFDVSIQNVYVYYANDSGIQIEDSADVKLQNVYVEGCGGTDYGGNQPLLGAGISIIGSKDCYLDNCYSDTNYFGFLIEADSLTNNLPNNIFLSECEATLCQQTGLSIGTANGLVLSDSLVAGSSGDGIDIVDSLSVTVANTIIQGNSGNGLVINSQRFNLTQSLITIQNCNVDANGKNGISIYSQNNMTIGDINILDCQITNSGASVGDSPAQPGVWDGVNINTDLKTGGNCSNIQISTCFIGNENGATPTQNFGVQSLGNSDYIQVFQNDFFNNLAGNYSLVGANNSIENNF